MKPNVSLVTEVEVETDVVVATEVVDVDGETIEEIGLMDYR